MRKGAGIMTTQEALNLHVPHNIIFLELDSKGHEICVPREKEFFGQIWLKTTFFWRPLVKLKALRSPAVIIFFNPGVSI